MTEALFPSTPMPNVIPPSPGSEESAWEFPSRTIRPVLPQTAPEHSLAPPALSPSPTRAEQQQQMRVRVVVVDDQVIMRNGIHFSLRDYQDIEVVAMVGSGEEALEACARLRPDVVLMDLLMPGMGGMEALEALHASAPEMHIVALTSFREGNVVEEALQAGAIGYLLKDVAVEDLAKAIRLARRGIPTLSPAAGQALVHAVASRPAKIGQDLTQQELKVLELLTAGLSNQQIAERLVITPATVKFHIHKIRSKLGTSSRTETVVQALRHHLVPGVRSA